MGNKLSLIGVYQGTLLVSDFPVTLPKLCAVIGFVTAAVEPVRAMRIRLLRNDSPILQHDVEEEFLKRDTPPVAVPGIDIHPNAQISQINMPLVLSPFVAEQPMILRVRVDADGKEHRGQGLIIRKAA